MGGINKGGQPQPTAATQQSKDGKDQPKKGFEKEGINFGKSRPTFKKSEHVGNKGEFPELGDEVTHQ
jgi:hypothetical protein